MSHISVLVDEIVEALVPPENPPERAIDGTLGAGGHTRRLLEAGAGAVLGIDLDEQALGLARAALADFGERAHLVQGSYRRMAEFARALGWDAVDAILLDLGVSSMQLDTPERGFAFRHDGPLDMRFDPARGGVTAADIVNGWAEGDLAQILREYGEEPLARLYARKLAEARPFHTTRELADLIAAVAPRPKRREGKATIHPATRVFQALRIAVNDELGTVAAALPEALALLRPGGRLAVISFHSLEDRIVKQFFREVCTERIAPPGMASLGSQVAQARLITRKPIEPSAAEIAANPRSRSSKLRVLEKLGR